MLNKSCAVYKKVLRMILQFKSRFAKFKYNKVDSEQSQHLFKNNKRYKSQEIHPKYPDQTLKIISTSLFMLAVLMCGFQINQVKEQ